MKLKNGTLVNGQRLLNAMQKNAFHSEIELQCVFLLSGMLGAAAQHSH